MNVEEAIKRGVLDPTSAIFHDPKSKVAFSVDKAIAHGLLDDTGHYVHYRTRQTMTLQDMIKEEILVLSDKKGGKVPVISETKKVVVKTVLDPRSGDQLDPETAARRGLLDTDRGTYRYAAQFCHFIIKGCLH